MAAVVDMGLQLPLGGLKYAANAMLFLVPDESNADILVEKNEPFVFRCTHFGNQQRLGGNARDVRATTGEFRE